MERDVTGSGGKAAVIVAAAVALTGLAALIAGRLRQRLCLLFQQLVQGFYFRPGKPTTDFIKKVLNKVTLFGAIYLGVVAILPLLIGKIVGNSSLSIGGTSVIIVVGVALETVQALESQMLMRQYKGFLE